jgi:hypothetical protein
MFEVLHLTVNLILMVLLALYLWEARELRQALKDFQDKFGHLKQ